MANLESLNKTPLYQQHLDLKAKLVDFGGWALPVNYGSQVEEHNAVRKRCGMFDVSHMTVSDLKGAETIPMLSFLLANNIDKAASLEGKALYSCMLNEQGGVIDDLIVYRLNDEHCRIVTNGATNKEVVAWFKDHAKRFDVDYQERPELGLIAVQGPSALEECLKVSGVILGAQSTEVLGKLKRFQGLFLDQSQSLFAGRTGYTGEDGLEFILPAHEVQALWMALIESGVQPCGLGARDTLRLEAGMSLYGNDLDTKHTPIESGIGWSVDRKSEREFIGKAALEKPAARKMIGLSLIDRGVLRSHQAVFLKDTQIGEITSGSFSPTLEKSIALARIEASAETSVDMEVEVEIRNKRLKALVSKYPFVKN